MISELPYDFDLLYDIKTLDDLQRKHTELVSELVGLENLMKHYNILTERLPDTSGLSPHRGL